MNFQKKILVIDGDQHFGKAIKRTLTLHKYEVCYVSSASAVVQKAFEFQPDIILCDTDLQPVDGFQVHKILIESFVLKSIPFIFLKLNANVEQIRQGMNLGADDYFSKPFPIADLLRSIETQLDKYQYAGHQAVQYATALFDLSPNGIMIFSESAILRANRSLQSLLKIDLVKSIPSRMEDIFENSSLLKVKSWMQQPIKSTKSVFKDRVTLKDMLGEELEMELVMNELNEDKELADYIGFFTPVMPAAGFWVNGQVVQELLGLMEHEKIILPAHFAEKIHQLVHHRAINYTFQEHSLFTKRENQVLFLTMEGLPIKNIADKLSISTRTVEKYRTHLMEKSGAKNIVEVIVFALKNGLIQI